MPSIGAARDRLRQLINPGLHPATAWVSELAGILPLSALNEFTDIPRTLHMFQLTGRIPLWCWPVTPAASRILLQSDPTAPGCWLDQANASSSPLCMDCREGNQYPMSNHETIRMCVEATTVNQDYSVRSPKNPSTVNKQNVEAEKEKRIQHLEIVLVLRNSDDISERRPATDEEYGSLYGGDKSQSQLGSVRDIVRSKNLGWWRYRTAVAIGWLLWTGSVIACGILHLWLALAFLLATACVGITVSSIHGRHPHRIAPRDIATRTNKQAGTDGSVKVVLRQDDPARPIGVSTVLSDGNATNDYSTKEDVDRAAMQTAPKDTSDKWNRLIVSADNVNATHWRAFYGETALVNSLLNWPMASHQPKSTRGKYLILRVFILGQWAMAIGSAALKGWDGYFISFWILLCILSANFLFATDWDAKQWLDEANVSLRRYQITLSSRRALLGTPMRLNHDTFDGDGSTDANRVRNYAKCGNLWMNPVWKFSDNGPRETAMRRALHVPLTSHDFEEIGKALSVEQQYFWKFIKEGIEMGELVRDGVGMANPRAS